jgi:hypothetical protein
LDVIEGYQKANSKRVNERIRHTVPARDGFVPKISDFLGFFSIQRGEGPAFSDLRYLLVVNVLAITKPILWFARAASISLTRNVGIPLLNYSSPHFCTMDEAYQAQFHSLAKKGRTAYPQKPPI